MLNRLEIDGVIVAARDGHDVLIYTSAVGRVLADLEDRCPVEILAMVSRANGVAGIKTVDGREVQVRQPHYIVRGFTPSMVVVDGDVPRTLLAELPQPFEVIRT